VNKTLVLAQTVRRRFHLPESTKRWPQVQPRLHSLKPDQTLFLEGDSPNQLYQVRSGWMKMLRASSRGQDTIVELLFPGDYFDIAHALDGEPSTVTASSLTRHPAEIACLDKESLELMPHLRLVLQQQFLSQVRAQQARMVALATERAEIRHIVALHSIGQRVGKKQGTTLTIPMLLSRQEFGELSGTSSETTIRILARFRSLGWICWSGQDIVCQAELFEPRNADRLA
jgi:CRP/FNR family transcriptional regulator